MKTITIRKIPPRVERAIRRRARIQKTSANKAVIGLIEDHLGNSVSESAAEYHDLDELAGPLPCIASCDGIESKQTSTPNCLC